MTPKQIAEWEQKAADGSLTLEDVREYVNYLRQGRNSAMTTLSKKRKVTQPQESKDVPGTQAAQ